MRHPGGTPEVAPATVVAVDVGSSERGLETLVEGVLVALAESRHLHCVLVGPGDAIAGCLPPEAGARVRVHSTAGTVSMSDDPVTAVRNRRDTSIVVAAGLVRRGEASAMVTSANTGAVVLAGGARLRRVPGVVHPALAAILPTPGSRGVVLVDCGASPVRSPDWLVQYATLGTVTAGTLLGLRAPRVGLIANGTESTKGDDVVRAAHERLCRRAGYIGLVEPWHVVAGLVDVVVSDGWSGNLVLKSFEAGTWAAVTEMQRAFDGVAGAEVRARLVDAVSWVRRTPGFGGLLLGVGGVVVKIHGENGDTSDVVGGIRLAAAASRSALVERVATAFRTPNDAGGMGHGRRLVGAP